MENNLKNVNENLRWIFEQNKAWIENCDTKTTTVLSVVGIAITIIFSSDSIKNMIDLFDKVWFYQCCVNKLFCILYLAGGYGSLIYGISNLFRVLTARLDSSRYSQIESYKSNIFFGDIAIQDFKTVESSLHSVDTQNFNNDLIKQIFICACICDKKFKYYSKGGVFISVGISVIIIFNVIGYLIF